MRNRYHIRYFCLEGRAATREKRVLKYYRNVKKLMFRNDEIVIKCSSIADPLLGLSIPTTGGGWSQSRISTYAIP